MTKSDIRQESVIVRSRPIDTKKITVKYCGCDEQYYGVIKRWWRMLHGCAIWTTRLELEQDVLVWMK